MTTNTPSAPAVLLLGDPGRGKTYSLGSLVTSPHVEKVFYLYTDPGGDESLIDSIVDRKGDLSKVHMHYVAPASKGWSALEDLAKKINMMDFQALGNLKQGIDKAGYRQFFEILACLSNFKCDRTGEEFGPADKFPNNWAVIFDSLTGLNKIARETAVGAKPTLHQGEWGTAMSMEENFIRKFAADIKGPRVMIGHLDKVMMELEGRMMFQVSLLGNKLAPHIPHLFSDVIHADRDGTGFVWSTNDQRISLKSRNLPESNKLKPDFGPILEKWRSRCDLYANMKDPETGNAPVEGQGA